MIIDRPTFGPGGNSESFYAEGNKGTVNAPKWVRERGLDAYEFEAGNGLNATDATLARIGEEARANGILMSFHTPYFISLSGIEEEKRLKSIDYIKRSLHASELLGADTIVVHSEDKPSGGDGACVGHLGAHIRGGGGHSYTRRT